MFRKTLFLFVVILFLGVSQAQAKTNLLFIMDGSNSMWGQVEGEAKITSAQNVMENLLTDLPPKTDIGFMVYGHREKESCQDIEVLSAVGEKSGAELVGKIKALKPKGKTPVAGSLSKALEVMSKYEGENNHVILISDGVETCDGDPCAAAQALADAGIKSKVHVVGFAIGKDERRQLECIPEMGNGKYFSASNAAELKQAVAEVKEAALTEAVPEDKKPKMDLWFEDSFEGTELKPDWEVVNEDLDAYIVENEKLTVIASQTSGFANATLPNIFKLNKNLPESDWTVTLKLTGKYQTGIDDFWLGLYDDSENFIAGQMYLKEDIYYGHSLGQNMHKMIKGKPTKDDGALHFSLGCNVCTPEKSFAIFAADHVKQPLYMRLRKEGRKYIFDMRAAGEFAEDGALAWRDEQTLTSLRAPKHLVFAGSQWKKTTSETVFHIDEIKIEVSAGGKEVKPEIIMEAEPVKAE